MKRTIAVGALLLLALQACASPDGKEGANAAASDWIKASDGSYTHKASGALCPIEVEGFALQGLKMPEAPGSLGTCLYADSAGRRGEIRVRRYIPGVGETPLAIQNDKTLMEGATSSSDQVITSTIRAGPGPEINGERSQRDVITVKRNGLLIDCAAWERVSQFEDGSPIVDFGINCLHMPGEG
ncbi:hypothetical protein FRZ61_11680 [Hypericibacter adhaerens]|uniref:Lipoprotein n=1 Tax=Hypericibacter adhaerens TaxID=2602016 RepID=A0A5J6MX22_9PROT|nr:hypothetical protein [Hypericibacter adhaerens]QEX21245.1 hypothetical protein FRZ61_11680 [Hypericibacter adhaerens]